MDEAELDRLFELPLAEFVPERNALARQLKQTGQTEDAERVKELAKPSQSAWLVNQLVRRHRPRVVELLAALDRVRAAQLGALNGNADAPALSEAVRDERESLSRIADLIPRLAEPGQTISQNMVDRALRSLRAAAADASGRTLLEQGRLTEDFQDQGFAALAASLEVPREAGPERRKIPKMDTIDLEIEEHRRLAAQKREEQAALRRREEERRLRDERRRALKKRLDGGHRALEAARQRETHLEREHRTLERQRAELERRLEEVRREAETVRVRLEEAKAEGRAAEGELDDLRAELKKLE